VVEALDSVNLMTVHASKGLEFPVVFLVNLAKGATAPPRPVRIALSSTDQPSVSVGPFVSESDEAERDAERHETRRLLYVALTRARDRLYLASTLKENAFAPARGSLAEVLPDSLQDLFVRAATVPGAVDTLAWTGVSGREYAWRVCRAEGDAAGAGPEELASPADGDKARAGGAGVPMDDLGVPQSGSERRRVPATALLGDAEAAPDRGPGISDRLIGVLVHRLFASAEGLAPESDPVALCRRMLRDDERLRVEDAESVVRRAAELWAGAQQRPDVVSALAGPGRLFEVPFSLVPPGSPDVIRGTIDCIVCRDDGSLLVLEFKTGRPQPIHQQQVDLYVQAAALLFPDRRVDGAVLYI
jgi:ATP-dependent helicase/nuclease subunit A